MNKSRNKKGQFKQRETGEFFQCYPIYKDFKGYKLIWVDGKSVKLHVYVWELENGEKPEGFDIHHIDHDKGNYNIENLQLLSKSDHSKVHAGWLKTEGEWSHKPCNGCEKILELSAFYKRKDLTPSALCKCCHIEKTKKWALKNKEKVKLIKKKSYMKIKEQGGKK